MRKVFFNPAKNGHVAPRFTPIPVETDNGIVHAFLSNEEISSQIGVSDCMEFDPAFLASKGISPIGFSGSIFSPLDAVTQLSDNVYNLDLQIINDVNNISNNNINSDSNSNVDKINTDNN